MFDLEGLQKIIEFVGSVISILLVLFLISKWVYDKVTTYLRYISEVHKYTMEIRETEKELLKEIKKMGKMLKDLEERIYTGAENSWNNNNNDDPPDPPRRIDLTRILYVFGFSIYTYINTYVTVTAFTYRLYEMAAFFAVLSIIGLAGIILTIIAYKEKRDLLLLLLVITTFPYLLYSLKEIVAMLSKIFSQ